MLIRRLQKAEHELAIIRQTGYLSRMPLQEKACSVGTALQSTGKLIQCA